MNRNIRKLLSEKSGVTLIEMLLYISISAIMLTAVALFLQLITTSRIKNQVVNEVEQQGLQIMQEINQKIRNSEAVISPTVGNSASSLSLDLYNPLKDPAVYSLSSGNLELSEGAGSTSYLNSNQTIVTNLVFTNLTRDNSESVIRIEFTLDHINPSGRNEYNYSKTFYSTASIRR